MIVAIRSAVLLIWLEFAYPLTHTSAQVGKTWLRPKRLLISPCRGGWRRLLLLLLLLLLLVMVMAVSLCYWLSIRLWLLLLRVGGLPLILLLLQGLLLSLQERKT